MPVKKTTTMANVKTKRQKAKVDEQTPLTR